MGLDFGKPDDGAISFSTSFYREKNAIVLVKDLRQNDFPDGRGWQRLLGGFGVGAFCFR
jgi:hypothetical protein